KLKEYCSCFVLYMTLMLSELGVGGPFEKTPQIKALLDMASNEEMKTTDWVFKYMSRDDYSNSKKAGACLDKFIVKDKPNVLAVRKVQHPDTPALNLPPGQEELLNMINSRKIKSCGDLRKQLFKRIGEGETIHPLLLKAINEKFKSGINGELKDFLKQHSE
ncbi:MAG: hypothetical protein IJJ33_07640, partial [Victivallales bacterium]|nr:hypothetical protein [Victivallales bacterium]